VVAPGGKGECLLPDQVPAQVERDAVEVAEDLQGLSFAVPERPGETTPLARVALLSRRSSRIRPRSTRHLFGNTTMGNPRAHLSMTTLAKAPRKCARPQAQTRFMPGSGAIPVPAIRFPFYWSWLGITY